MAWSWLPRLPLRADRRCRKTSRRPRLRIEELESRLAPSASTTYGGLTFVIDGAGSFTASGTISPVRVVKSSAPGIGLRLDSGVTFGLDNNTFRTSGDVKALAGGSTPV